VREGDMGKIEMITVEATEWGTRVYAYGDDKVVDLDPPATADTLAIQTA
jgi:hypothetical protein